MRTISIKIKEAFNARRPLTVGNTRTDGTTVFLHGNAIIRHTAAGVEVTLAGWNTSTTRSRIKEIAGVSCHTSKGQPFLNGVEVSTREWVRA